MGQSWTDEQMAAITVRDCNLLVSAAAGAGKTAVLVERLIRRITDRENPVDVDRLLVVTFTKAAAAEMRERIGQALARELNLCPASRHLNRQIKLLNRASITTLHSFCLEITRSFFYLLDLDPNFRVADDTEGALLQMEVLDDLFEELYAAGDEGFLALVDAFGRDRDDGPLQAMVLKLYNFAIGTPWPDYWLKGLGALYQSAENQTLDGHPWGKTLLAWARLELESCRMKLTRALALTEKPGGPQAYQATLQDDLAQLDDLLRALDCSWQESYAAFQNLQYGKLKACRDKSVDETLKEQVRKIREEVKKRVNDLQEEVFGRSPAELRADLVKMAGQAENLSRLVIHFRERYRRIKAAKSLVDFADLEHCCLQVLTAPGSTPEKVIPSPVALELRKYYQEVLVDEYQDINAVQEMILQLISRQGEEKPNLFMVGDVKQSIYRFRLAEPALFMAKYQAYPRHHGEPDQGIDLTRNFRSRREIIDAVNYVFRQIMTSQVGEMEYDEKAELVWGARYLPPPEGINSAAGPVELHLLEKSGEETQELSQGEADLTGEETRDPGEETRASGEEENLDAVQREARVVACRIRRMVSGSPETGGPEFQVYDKVLGGYRPVRYRDIVILMRATRGAASVFLEELRQGGIPAYADLGTGYFNAIEVETVMALLQVIDNPRQDIPLAAVLRSPIVGLTAEDLAAIRLVDIGGEFYDALRQAASTESVEDLAPEALRKVREFLRNLEGWRTMARQGSLADLIWRLYDETGYYAYVGAMPGGPQRQANLRALYDRARQFEATSFRGLFRFLRFIEKFRESGQDLGAARALGENEDVVRIMSIHKSKGLEFPVVFVTGLGKQFNTGDLREKALLHKELGLGLQVVNPGLSLCYPSVAFLAIKKRLLMELLSEEMRILYVALTRAREKLILVGTVKDLAKAAAQWCLNVSHPAWLLPQTDLASARTFLDWIGPVVARHPGGELIRKLAGIDFCPQGPTAKDPSRWQVYWHQTLEGLLPPEKGKDPRRLWERVKKLEPVDLTGGMASQVKDMLGWEYPHSRVVRKSAKVTVSEIKKHFVDLRKEEEAAPFLGSLLTERPRFLQQKSGLSASEKGTAMHLAMQHLDFRGDLSSEGIREQVQVLLRRQIITPEQAEAIDFGAIAGFFNSPLGRRVLTARRVKREIPFTLGIPAHLLYDDLFPEDGERVVVQGVIDCLLEEEDGMVLLDYKNNQVAGEEDLTRITREYLGQMNLYTRAVETILRRPVKERYLYLFSIGKEVLL